jgi:hypothetical protein
MPLDGYNEGGTAFHQSPDAAQQEFFSLTGHLLF